MSTIGMLDYVYSGDDSTEDRRRMAWELLKLHNSLRLQKILRENMKNDK